MQPLQIAAIHGAGEGWEGDNKMKLSSAKYIRLNPM